jgi:hypothetical protein
MLYQKKLKEFECRDDDVWVGSFPKCGKTGKINMSGIFLFCVDTFVDLDISRIGIRTQLH